jgi:Tol biopolymer transport system component
VHVAISPDERRIAAERLDPKTGIGGIWMLNPGQTVFSRFVADHPEWSMAPTWSPDSSRILFAGSRRGPGYLYVKALDGSGDQDVFTSEQMGQANDLLADGTIIFSSSAPSGSRLWAKPPDSGSQPRLLGKGAGNENAAKLSPDGRWLAYVSNESGRRELYVRSFDGSGGRTQVSAGGGDQPRWRRDGKELFFLADDGTIMAAAVTTGATFSVEPPQPLLIKTERDITGARYTYDVADLGKRFLVNRAFGADPAPAITVILNWQARLPR